MEDLSFWKVVLHFRYFEFSEFKYSESVMDGLGDKWITFSPMSTDDMWYEEILDSDFESFLGENDLLNYCFQFITCFCDISVRDEHEQMIEGVPSQILLNSLEDKIKIQDSLENLCVRWKSKRISSK